MLMSILLRLPAAPRRHFTLLRLLGHLAGTSPVAFGWLNPTWFSAKFFLGHAGCFRFHSISTRNKAVLEAWDNGRRNFYWKRTLFVQSRAGREQMNPLGNDSFCENQTLFLSARIQCSGTVVDQLTEALMCFGASSVSIEDANSENMGQAFSDGLVPWEPRKREFWNQSCITAIFTADQDVGECLAFAADSIGLKEIPEYKIAKRECYNWEQQAQQILYLQSVSLLLTIYAVKLLNLETSSGGNRWCSQRPTMPMDMLQDMFQPTQVSDGLWIIPKWRAPPDPQAINIILDPGVAFGTGEHPTTRLCLLFLREFVNGGEHVLDYGTGSGILSIAALKMGAAKAIGVDIDPMAVASANRNAALNSFGPDKMQVFLASNDGNNPLSSVAVSEGITRRHPVTATSDTLPAKYDIVVANILLNPLLELASQIMGYVRPGGVVGLSGIILDQVPQVQECYSPFLENMTVSQADGWAFIKGRKKLLH